MAGLPQRFAHACTHNRRLTTMTFHGSLEELQALVASLGVAAHWEHKGPFELAVIDDGISNLRLNWWPATGELELVGDPEQRQPLLLRLQQALG